MASHCSLQCLPVTCEPNMVWTWPSRPHLPPLLCPCPRRSSHRDSYSLSSPLHPSLSPPHPNPKLLVLQGSYSSCSSCLNTFLGPWSDWHLLTLQDFLYVAFQRGPSEQPIKRKFYSPTPKPLILLFKFHSFLTQNLTTICNYLLSGVCSLPAAAAGI